jgi:hypothetical protein
MLTISKRRLEWSCAKQLGSSPVNAFVSKAETLLTTMMDSNFHSKARVWHGRLDTEEKRWDEIHCEVLYVYVRTADGFVLLRLHTYLACQIGDPAANHQWMLLMLSKRNSYLDIHFL